MHALCVRIYAHANHTKTSRFPYYEYGGALKSRQALSMHYKNRFDFCRWVTMQYQVRASNPVHRRGTSSSGMSKVLGTFRMMHEKTQASKIHIKLEIATFIRKKPFRSAAVGAYNYMQATHQVLATDGTPARTMAIAQRSLWPPCLF